MLLKKNSFTPGLRAILDFKPKLCWFTALVVYTAVVFFGTPDHVFAATPVVYYDADELISNKQNEEVVAKGNVFFLLGNIFLSADKITYTKNTQNKHGLVVAEGNVTLLRGKERIRASRIILDQETREARMDSVEITANPELSDDRAKNEALSVSIAEIAFEASRLQRTQELEKELKLIREKFFNARNLERINRSERTLDGKPATQAPSYVFLRQYSQILERLSRTKFQPNLVLDALPQDEKERLKRRRQAAETIVRENPEAVNRVVGLQSTPGYIRIRAKELYQNPSGTYEIYDATLTPCNCDSNETPIWGLSTRKGHVEPEQYVTLYGASTDILSVPTVYLPWLKFPIKSKRQSGFLLPSFFSSKGGEVYSQPFFLNISESVDSTLTYNYFSSRGSRYDAEFRAQIFPETRLFLYGEYIRDTQYGKDRELAFASAKEKINEEKKAGTLTKAKEYKINRSTGDAHPYRYYTSNSVSLPVTAWGAAKVQADLVSDNRYLTDFSKETEAAQDLFTPNQSAKRFLTQEASAEYYGNNTSLSLRMQGKRDTFADLPGDTPVRLPRVEFFLLPQRFFNNPVSFEAQASWERVHRVGGTPFLDIDKEATVAAPVGKEEQPIYLGKDNQRDPSEPFVEGDRSSIQSAAYVPLASNRFVNAFAGVRGVTTQYRYPHIQGWDRQTPYQTYASLEAKINMPLSGTATLNKTPGLTDYASTDTLNKTTSVRDDFTPSLAFTFIPEVARSDNYPKTGQHFYAEDDVVSKQELALSITNAWTIYSGGFKKQYREVRRLPPDVNDEVANEAILKSILEKKYDSKADSPEEIFEISGTDQSHEIFLSWAQLELNSFEQKVLQSDFGKSFAWPNSESYRNGKDWSFTPLNFSLSTTYNFQAEKTAQEITAQRNPGDPKVTAEPWGPLVGTIGWNLSPFVPLRGGFYGTWNRKWERLETAGTTVSASLPYGLSASFGNGYKVVEVRAEPEKKNFPIERTIDTDIGWQALKWLRFQYQRKVSIISDRRNPVAEFEYTTVQRVSFLQLQDCLDVSVQRFKDLGVRERYAVWSLAINLRFMGQERGFENIGYSLDREIQQRNRRNDPGAGG